LQEVQQEIRDLRQQQVQQISNLLEDLAALRGRLAAQQTALADLADRGRTQADNLKRLAGELEALEESVHSLADSSVALRHEMAALHGKVVASNSGDEQLAARFQQLQAGLENPRFF
jgi:chromosome segregation ATPase